MANKPGEANFFPDVPMYNDMGMFQPVYGKFDLTTYIQGASDYEIMAFLVGKYNACLEAYDKVTKLSTDTITAAHQLQDWINNWFDNLDVQQELNNKIDQMVADGSFGTLLHQTFDTQINQQTTNAVTAWLVANVDPKGSAVVVDSSLSITGAAADAREAGFRDSRIAIASTLTKLNVTLKKDGNIGKIILDTDKPGDLSQHIVWSEHAYIDMSTRIDNRTATYNIPDNFNGFTAGLYADLNTYELVITPITSYQNQNSILLWAGFINSNWTLNVEVFNAYSMALNHLYYSTDKTLSIYNAPADARATGKGLSHIAIASTATKLDVTFEKTNDTTITFNVEANPWELIWNEHQAVNTSYLTTSATYTFDSDTFNGGTIGLYWNGTTKKLEAHSIFDDVPVYSILIWTGFFDTSWHLKNVVFNAKTMALNQLYNAIPINPEINYNRIDTIGNNCASIFTKVVCCGDSYTSGHITTSSGTIATNEDFAWPKYAAQITGNEYINCGRSGANVLTWQTDPRGLPKAKASGVAQCYIIGLGLNDSSNNSALSIELGTRADIGTDAQTYYGGYSKIIRELHKISPKAVIFCQTMPMASGLKLQYNEAVRTIVNQYASTYNAKLLNLNDYDNYYRKTTVAQNITGGHYTAAGYQQLAQILCYAISDYINAHPDEFKDIHRVPYDSTNVAMLSAENESDAVF